MRRGLCRSPSTAFRLERPLPLQSPGSKITMFGRSIPLFRLAGFQVGID
jgi:hypothetical protein